MPTQPDVLLSYGTEHVFKMAIKTKNAHKNEFFKSHLYLEHKTHGYQDFQVVDTAASSGMTSFN